MGYLGAPDEDAQMVEDLTDILEEAVDKQYEDVLLAIGCGVGDSGATTRVCGEDNWKERCELLDKKSLVDRVVYSQ